jgi:hypothetical protein
LRAVSKYQRHWKRLCFYMTDPSRTTRAVKISGVNGILKLE